MLCWFKQIFWLNLAWGSAIQTDGKWCWGKNIQHYKIHVHKQQVWEKYNYFTYWKELTKTPSKLECYLALHREYTVALWHLTTVSDLNLRKALTMYRFSEHSPAIEKGRRRQTWLSREDRLCAHCPQNEVETELLFLTSCQMYDHIRDTYFPQITQIHKEFKNKSNFDKFTYLLGEIPQQQDVWPVARRNWWSEEQTPL